MRGIEPSLFFVEALDQHIEEDAKLRGHVPTVRIKRDDLEFWTTILKLYLHQRSGREEVGDDIRRH
jgi:hypothetical protein